MPWLWIHRSCSLTNPLRALDPLIRREMQDELCNLQLAMRKTMIFITHDFLEALKMGDQIAIMKDGELVQVGTPKEIVARPVNAYVRAFTRDAPRAKVLDVASVMQPLGSIALDASPVAMQTLLADAIPLVLNHAGALPVIDASGQRVGQIDERTLLAALGGDV